MMDETKKGGIVQRLKAVLLSAVPEAAFVEKYGGTVVESAPGQPKTQFCGVFACKTHVSLEFTNGVQLDDPGMILDGSGKHRRHIKVARLSDIVEKRCEDFLRQARTLQADLI